MALLTQGMYIVPREVIEDLGRDKRHCVMLPAFMKGRFVLLKSSGQLLEVHRMHSLLHVVEGQVHGTPTVVQVYVVDLCGKADVDILAEDRLAGIDASARQLLDQRAMYLSELVGSVCTRGDRAIGFRQDRRDKVIVLFQTFDVARHQYMYHEEDTDARPQDMGLLQLIAVRALAARFPEIAVLVATLNFKTMLRLTWVMIVQNTPVVVVLMNRVAHVLGKSKLSPSPRCAVMTESDIAASGRFDACSDVVKNLLGITRAVPSSGQTLLGFTACSESAPLVLYDRATASQVFPGQDLKPMEVKGGVIKFVDPATFAQLYAERKSVLWYFRDGIDTVVVKDSPTSMFAIHVTVGSQCRAVTLRPFERLGIPRFDTSVPFETLVASLASPV